MIPQFPLFEKVSLDNKDGVYAVTDRFVPYSDFNFTSLWSWDTSNERQVSLLNDNLVVRFTDYSTNAPFISFLGNNKTDETVRTLIDYSKQEGLPTELSLIPETSVQGLSDSEFHIVEDRANFDYVYSVDDHVDFEGPEYRTKRRRVNKFTRENPLARVAIEDLHANTHIQSDIFAVISAWEKNKVREAKEYELEHELLAIQRLFSAAELHNLFATCVYADALMIGFSIDETIKNSEYAVSHFAKYDSTYPGVYEFLAQQRALHLKSLGIKFVNCEQDLDIPGLRQSKESYVPCHFLKKYKLSTIPN